VLCARASSSSSLVLPIDPPTSFLLHQRFDRSAIAGRTLNRGVEAAGRRGELEMAMSGSRRSMGRCHWVCAPSPGVAWIGTAGRVAGCCRGVVCCGRSRCAPVGAVRSLEQKKQWVGRSGAILTSSMGLARTLYILFDISNFMNVGDGGDSARRAELDTSSYATSLAGLPSFDVSFGTSVLVVICYDATTIPSITICLV